MIKHNNQSAFTLIELIIAVAVFTVGIMGAFTLALANLRVARENQDRVLAADLAREGLEIMRNVRDTNWLRLYNNEDCDPLMPGSQLCAHSSNMQKGLFAVDIYDYYPTLSPSPIGTCPNPNEQMENCNCLGNSCDLWLDNSNYYYHPPQTPPDEHGPATATNIERKILVRPLCFNGAAENRTYDNQGDCTGPNNVEIGSEIWVRVDWTRHGQSYNVVVKELLYNWRR